MTRARVSTAALATLTTGIVMVESFTGVGEAAEAVLGHPVWTHELPGARERIRELVFAQLPDFPAEATSLNWQAVRAAAIERFGETVEIEVGTDQRSGSPLATLADKLEGMGQ